MKAGPENRRCAEPWKVKVITLFPELFPGPLDCSLAGKALQDGLWRLETIGLREFGAGPHRNVDDRPLGGGPGMVYRPDVVAAALEAAAVDTPSDPEIWPCIFFTPRGRRLRQAQVEELSRAAGMTLLCGRFEGVDERVLQRHRLSEISIGDYVLSGGEIAAHVLIDAIVRRIPRVLGNQASIEEESYASGLLEYPQYTRPRVWQEISVPEVLLSGNHAEIVQWRRAEAERATRLRRPDLWQAHRGGRQSDT